MKVVFDLDDGSILRNRWDLLLKLKELYPNLKLSLFWIPFDFEYEKSMLRVNRETKLKMIKDNLDWIELIPHGLSHIPQEFMRCDKETMKVALQAIDECMVRDGLPYVKGFKAPYWLWNQDVVDVLDDEGWFGASDRNQPDMPKTKRDYVFTHSIHENFWEDKQEFWGLHGHMTEPSENALERCIINMTKIPQDAEFKFVSEVI